MQARHDLLRARQHRRPSRGARRLDVHRRDAAQLRVDLGEERPQVKLAGEQAGGEVADHARAHVAGVGPRRCNCAAARFDQDVAQTLAFFCEIPLKVGTRGADEINRLGHQPILRYGILSA